MTFNIINKIMAAATNLSGLKTKTPPPVYIRETRIFRKGEDIWYKIKSKCSVLINKDFFSSFYGFLLNYNSQENKQQFKDIQLQLHANTVNNPYTFSIQGNRSFSGSCVAALPTSDTYLLDYEVSNEADKYVSITIPEGVKVVWATVDQRIGGYSYIKNTSNNKIWSESWRYVGVTPGKTYNLYLSGEPIYDEVEEYTFTIRYSASINNQSVDVADY